MTVPRLLLLTDRHRSEACGRTLVDTVTQALAAGAPAVVLREKDLPRPARRALALELLEAARRWDADLLIASDVDLATQVGATGVHLAAADTPADDAPGLTGRSCHTRSAVRAAAERGHDYVTVSPVAASRSKPGYGPELGRGGLTQIVAAAEGLPVLALGGVTATNAASWLEAGAHGVAVMDAVMGAANPGANVSALLDALAQEAP